MILKPIIKLISYSKNPLQLIYITAKQYTSDECIEDYFDHYGNIINSKLPSIHDQEKFILKSKEKNIIEHISFTFSINNISQTDLLKIISFKDIVVTHLNHQKNDYKKLNIIEQCLDYNKPSYYMFHQTINMCQQTYNQIKKDLNNKRAINFLKVILPNPILSQVIITMNCQTLLYFFNINCCNDEPKESRIIANNMLNCVKKILPVIFKNAGAICDISGYCPKSISCGKKPTLTKILEVYNNVKNNND